VARALRVELADTAAPGTTAENLEAYNAFLKRTIVVDRSGVSCARIRCRTRKFPPTEELLRGHPRYEALLVKMNLDEASLRVVGLL
jgi:hypothetical protein